MKGRSRPALLRIVDHGHELLGLEAEAAELGEELAALVEAVDHQREHHQQDQRDAEVAEQGEEVGAALGDVAEEAAGEEPGAAPDERAGHVVEDERAVGDPESGRR